MNRSIRLREIALTVCAVLFLSVLSAQLTITEVKAKPLGSVVTFEGIATTGDEFGDIRYIQDDSAAIAAFPGFGSQSGFDQIKPGDKLQITGVLTSFRGLLEITPIMNFSVISENETLPPVVIGTFEEISDEAHLGKRVNVLCATFAHLQDDFQYGNYRIYDRSGAASILSIDGSNPLDGAPMPDGAFDVVGISSFEYKPRLLVSSAASFIARDCPSVSLPNAISIDKADILFQWTSSDTGFTVMRYGLTSEDLTIESNGQNAVDHEIRIENLASAQLLYFQSGVDVAGDTAWSPVIPFITKSESSGETFVYFNNPVEDGNAATDPDGETFEEMMDAIFELISSANTSIDIAMYNINRDEIVNALEVAYASGVRIRYIADGDQSNRALDPLPDFPVLFRSGSGIMHNKFLVVDPESASDARVWTGATNFTTNQLATDPNNSILFHDQSMARVYKMEFDEMWGGDGDTPNPQLAKQGSAKRDDTPHQLRVGDMDVEVYFSPSDFTNYFIKRELNRAEETINAALLLITREDLANTMVKKQGEGIAVRGIYNDPEFSEYALQILEQGGVDMRDYTSATIFHHKYALIDVQSNTNASVLTGSHNWTNSAELINDENTVILRSSHYAQVYSREFEARWDAVSTAVENVGDQNVLVYPNPYTDRIYISSDRSVKSVSLISIDGRIMAENTSLGKSMTWIPGIPGAGTYILRITLQNGIVLYRRVVKI